MEPKFPYLGGNIEKLQSYLKSTPYNWPNMTF